MEKRRVRHTDLFIEALFTRDVDDCVLWPYALTPYGYGTSREKLVHRMVCERTRGAPPQGKPFACHSCGVKRCVNPRHIYWGSPQDNSNDGVHLGEQARGEAHGSAKLTEQQVAEIKQSDETSRSLARRFGVSHTSIEQIKSGKLWKHVA